MMHFEQTWRWFGSYDTIPLEQIRQTGATGIVSALHHIPAGEVWPVNEIEKVTRQIESAGMEWSVVESIPVHEDIKKRSGNYQKYIENYIQSIQNVAACGIDTICYNFMPLTDWTRTHLNHPLPDGATTLRFNATAFAAFDLYILERDEAKKLYSADHQSEAKDYLDTLTKQQRNELTQTVLMGLPGDEEMTVPKFRSRLETYHEIGEQQLRDHLYKFLEAIMPAAEDSGVRMAIHPDDPPRPLFGLPRVVSTESDARELLDAVDSPNNGLTFCTGSFGANPVNDLPGMIERLGDRIHFVHLRSVSNEPDGSFQEARHLEGDARMHEVMKALIIEQQKRKESGRTDLSMPYRPDHGQRLLDDLNRESYPGYSGLGRLRGLAELRGLERGLRTCLEIENQ